MSTNQTPNNPTTEEHNSMSTDTATPDEIAGAGLVVREIVSAGILGIEAHPAYVTVCLGRPGESAGFVITGRDDSRTRETRDRVRAAILSAGYRWPDDRRVSVSVTCDVPTDAGTDVAIAVAILDATGQVVPRLDAGYWGELGLDGSVRPDPARALVAAMFQTLPTTWALDMIDGLEDLRPSSTAPPRLADWQRTAAQHLAEGDTVVIVGHPTTEQVRRVAEVTARELFQTGDEIHELAQIRAAYGISPTAPRQGPPIEHVNPTDGAVAILGGSGQRMRPGRVSLAHGGILVIDDVTETTATVLDGIRGAKRDGEIRVSRGGRTTTTPARFRVLAVLRPLVAPTDGAYSRWQRRVPDWLKVSERTNRDGGHVVHVVVPS